jgi:hypothetical protein
MSRRSPQRDGDDSDAGRPVGTVDHPYGWASMSVMPQGALVDQLRPTKGGIYGNLYLPKRTGGRRPALLVFSGSEGGLTTSMAAALLAAHGYPSLALAYFKVPGLPRP